MRTIKQLQAEIDGVLEKFNTEHLPAGSPNSTGGQFAPKGQGGKGGALGKGVKTISIDEEKKRIKAAGDEAAQAAGLIKESELDIVLIPKSPGFEDPPEYLLVDSRRRRNLGSGSLEKVERIKASKIKTAENRARNKAEQDERLLVEDERLGFF